MKVIILLTLLVSALSTELSAENFVKAVFQETILSISPEANPDLCFESLLSMKETLQSRTRNQTVSLFEALPLLFEILESSDVTSTCATPFQVFFNKYSTCFTKESIQENWHKYSFNIIENIANIIYHIQINRIDSQMMIYISESFKMLCGQSEPSLLKSPSPFDPTKVVPFNATKFSNEFSRGLFLYREKNVTYELASCLMSLFEFYETREMEKTGFEIFKVVENCVPLGRYLENVRRTEYLFENERVVELGLRILRTVGIYKRSIVNGVNYCFYGDYFRCGKGFGSVLDNLRGHVFGSLTKEGSESRVQANTPAASDK